RRDGGVVEVADDDVLWAEPLVGEAHDLLGRNERRVGEGPVPEYRRGVSDRGGGRAHARVVEAVWRAVERAGVDAVELPQQVVRARQLILDLPVGGGLQIGGAPGVVRQLDLARGDQRGEHVDVVRPRRVAAGREQGQPGAGRRCELRVGTHYGGVGAVVD